MIELRNHRATVLVDPDSGGRIAQFTLDGTSLLVAADSSLADSLDWGLYPMVPFAGRLRHGVLRWRDDEHRFEPRRPPHAIHGTVDDVRWDVDHLDESSCSLSTRLVEPWPFDATVVHDVALSDDRLEMRLTIHAREDMPVQLGWHPWFRAPVTIDLVARSIHLRDADGIASPTPTPAVDLPWGDLDDCLSDVDENLTIVVDGRRLLARSSCRYWVVYDRPAHATCVEPQSGPPNVLNLDPTIVSAGSSITEWFTLSWDV